MIAALVLADEAVRQGRIVPVLEGYTVARTDLWFITPSRGTRRRLIEAFGECIIEVMTARRLY